MITPIGEESKFEDGEEMPDIGIDDPLPNQLRNPISIMATPGQQIDKKITPKISRPISYIAENDQNSSLW